MKYLSVLVAISLIWGTTAVTQVTEAIKEECRKEIGVQRNEIDGVDTATLTEKQMCYIKCLFTKGGYLGVDGELETEKMKKDEIADGDAARLKRVFDCVESLDNIKKCNDIVGLVQCFKIR